MGLIFFAFFEKFFVPILTSGGYVGLSIATLLSQHHKVTAVDIIPEKVDMINNRKSPIQDDYIEKYLAEKELKYCDKKGNIDPAKLDHLMPWAEELPEECRKPRRS